MTVVPVVRERMDSKVKVETTEHYFVWHIAQFFNLFFISIMIFFDFFFFF